ncbi:hypothetical protein A3K86_20145 [Photobacterium jeanii]|uniref:Porin n=1 Tax=Photobacterium jeanii TaxID=858640 RepID=A0A178K1R1_9GAMM|nr:hypothetical protein [Photobacterium jeanii]OAN11269.1 hypothetical protein A3K86_20145 [Photobacterium jeanii]PST90789.1 hypothetical protein C9I91_09255 [Photobacterium jeanii]
MKKLLSLAVAIAVSAPAMADIYTDVNYKHSKHDVREAAAKVGYVMDNGLSFDLENVYDFKNKKNKEVTLGTAWKFDVVENGYIQPLAEVTFATNNSSHKFDEASKFFGDALDDKTFSITEKNKNGNTYKIGLKGGYEFDNGIYTSLRYRYEMNDSSWKLDANGTYDKKPVGATLLSKEDASRLHRTDLTVGYVIEDMADLSVNWIYKTGSTKIKGELLDLGKADITKLRASSSDIEFKAAANGLGDFVPYVQYTIKTSEKVKGFDVHGLEGEAFKNKRENEIKVGLVYNF